MPRRLLIVAVLLFVAIALGVVTNFLIKKGQDPRWNWQTYQSVKYGYKIRFPKDWKLDNSQKNEPADMVISPNGKALIIIQFLTDQRLLEKDGEKKVVADIKKSFESDPNYVISSFESRFETDGLTPATVSGYFVSGAQKYKNNVYRSIEYGIPLGDETYATIKALAREDIDEKLFRTTKDVATSFDPVTARTEALSLVKKQKEVKDYVERLSKSGKRAFFSVSDDKDNWLIWVYEIVKNRETTHTAIFNWYQVNKSTMKVSVN